MLWNKKRLSFGIYPFHWRAFSSNDLSNSWHFGECTFLFQVLSKPNWLKCDFWDLLWILICCYNWNISFKLEYFCWVRKLCGMFSFISSVSILVTSDNQFCGRQKKIPYFPASIAFQTLQTCLWSYIQTWKRLLGNTQERFYKVLLGGVFGNEEKSTKTLLFMYSLYVEMNMRMFDKFTRSRNRNNFNVSSERILALRGSERRWLNQCDIHTYKTYDTYYILLVILTYWWHGISKLLWISSFWVSL